MSQGWLLNQGWVPHGLAASVRLPVPAAADEAVLVRRSAAGDHESYALLVRLHQHRVFRLARRFFPRPQDVEEVAQETFLLAWRKLHTYRATAPFEHWLTRLCLNCCYGTLRRMRNAPEQLAPGWDEAAPEHDPSAGLEVRVLLDRLAPQDRFVLVLLEGDGLTVGEVARRLGWSRVNVRVRAHRARKRLRKLLEEGLS